VVFENIRKRSKNGVKRLKMEEFIVRGLGFGGHELTPLIIDE
jgi:hypothetical protein